MDACVEFYEHFCGMSVVQRRESSRGDSAVVWMAEPGRESDFVLVLIPGGSGQPQPADDYGHIGFAVGSREEVDALAEAGTTRGCLVWTPRQEAFPVGYYCALSDPDGNTVEFSYGQPLGPGAI